MRRLALVLLLTGALAGAAGASTRQAPEPETGVLAIGDFGVGGAPQRQLGAAVRRFEAANPSQVLTTLGDNDYTENPAAFRDNWLESFGWLRRGGVAVAGSLGNHDVRVERGRYQFALLGMPGPTYRRKVGLVELFVLDSNSVDEAQTVWLARALRSSRARWKIAVFHHPAWTCGTYRRHDAIVARWVPLFERYRVRLVLSGHDHNYQRFAPRRGVTYVVYGGGGAGLYDIAQCPTGYPRRVRARKIRGFVYLLARPDRLDGFAVSLASRRIDHFAIRAEG